ncbi:hypothetical protein [Nonomuraea bangladeshensis]|uniref:hypothetical protein n=1 Tax=Nonomuraea bangladeshensis TaxID=404385 RepID=UPI003C2B21A6
MILKVVHEVSEFRDRDSVADRGHGLSAAMVQPTTWDKCGVSRAASGRAADGPANVGHAEADGRRASGCLSHDLELLVGSDEGGLDGGNFTEPALFLGLGETVDEVGVDLFESRLLSWVNAKEGASDAGVFMRARGSEVAAACSERDLSQLEMGIAA